MFNVPDNTTINKQDYKPPRGVIAFAPELIKFILEGKKLSTYRYGDKYDYLNPGDDVQLQDSATKEIVCKAVISNKSQLSFAELPLRISAHESYRNKEHQRHVLSGYYAYLGRPLIDDDQFVKFDFQLKS